MKITIWLVLITGLLAYIAFKPEIYSFAGYVNGKIREYALQRQIARKNEIKREFEKELCQGMKRDDCILKYLADHPKIDEWKLHLECKKHRLGSRGGWIEQDSSDKLRRVICPDVYRYGSGFDDFIYFPESLMQDK